MKDTYGAIEEIRQQMEETKAHLTGRVETLEQQVTEAIESSSGVMDALGAVQGTLETVHGAVRSVRNWLNVRRQVDAHPWMVLAGSFTLGFLVSRVLAGKAIKPGNADKSTGNAVQLSMTSDDIVAVYEAGLEYSASHRVRSLAVDALAAVAQSVAIHAVPLAIRALAPPPTERDASTRNS